MARVLPYVEELVITDPTNNARVWVGHAGDYVPAWALEICSSPRAIDLDVDNPATQSVFPAAFPETF